MMGSQMLPSPATIFEFPYNVSDIYPLMSISKSNFSGACLRTRASFLAIPSLSLVLENLPSNYMQDTGHRLKVSVYQAFLIMINGR